MSVMRNDLPVTGLVCIVPYASALLRELSRMTCGNASLCDALVFLMICNNLLKLP